MYNKVLNTGKDLFILKRVIRESRLKNPDMGILKKFFHCDTVLRNDGRLFFCNKIKEVECE
jgi:hypothetical protein